MLILALQNKDFNNNSQINIKASKICSKSSKPKIIAKCFKINNFLHLEHLLSMEFQLS